MIESQAFIKFWPFIWLFAWFGFALWVTLFVDSSNTHVLSHSLESPSASHPFGFDAFGRDLVFLGSRASGLSTLIALSSLCVAFTFSLIAGAGIALLPKYPRFLALRALDTLLAFPSLLLGLAWAAISGPGWDTLFFSLAIGILPGLMRLICARSRELLSEEYIAAARVLGAGRWRILRFHLIPPLLDLCRVKLPSVFATLLLAEASLSFLGMGAPIGRDTWGSLLAQGKDYLIEAPHLAWAAGFPLVLTVLSLQVISERFGRRR